MLKVASSGPRVWRVIDTERVNQYVPAGAQGVVVYRYSFGYVCEMCDRGRQPYDKRGRVYPECIHIKRVKDFRA
tara:strand:- start:2796 stop:3017 length:222 start_codon:yes stop_codon:yes gene_type:complete